jgi:hypothetical protein
VIRLNTFFAALSEKALDSLVLEALNHSSIVTRSVTGVKLPFFDKRLAQEKESLGGTQPHPEGVTKLFNFWDELLELFEPTSTSLPSSSNARATFLDRAVRCPA